MHEIREMLVSQRTRKDWHTTEDIAQLLGKAVYTVREWCRYGRLNARKIDCGRGGEREWRISHTELERYQKDGLLPFPRKY